MPKEEPFVVHPTNDYVSAFNFIITAIKNHSSLIIPVNSDSLSVFADASLNGVGGALCVYRNSRHGFPVDFTLGNYCQEKRTMQFWIWKHWPYLQSYNIFTTIFLANTSKHLTITNHLSVFWMVNLHHHGSWWKIKLSEYHFDLLHISGEANPIADAWNSSPDEVVSLKKLEEASLKEGEVW